ncbi:MAG: DUF5074 domain-containing protein [Bacteroidota bacterium]
MHTRYIFAFLIFLALPAYGQTTRVAAVNQGNFSDGNGSITFYEPATGAVIQDVASGTGSIFQSAFEADGTVYIAANTGLGLELIDAGTGERTAQIEGVTGSRYAAAFEGVAYVSSQSFSSPSFVSAIDLATNTLLETIEVGGTPEGVAVAGGKVFVALGGFGSDSTLAVIDPLTNAVVDTVDADCDGTRSLATDADDELWVLCTGGVVRDANFNIIEETPGSLKAISPETFKPFATFTFDNDEYGTAQGIGQDLHYDAETQTLYVVSGASTIYRFDTSRNEFIDTIEAPEGDTTIESVTYAAGQLYLGRVLPAPDGFTSAGFVTIHDDAGTEVGRFEAGVAPAFLFSYETNVVLDNEPELPISLAGLAVYPNPFANAATLELELEQPAMVQVDVYTLDGRLVQTLDAGERPAGAATLRIEGASWPAGAYLVRVVIDGQAASRLVVRS